jgi:hypothetical protein
MPNRHIQIFFKIQIFQVNFFPKGYFVKLESFENNRDLQVTFDGFEYINKKNN